MRIVLVFSAVVLACTAQNFPPGGISTTCAATLCSTGTRCEEYPDKDGNTQARCVPAAPTCDNVRCGFGQRCVLRKVQCVTTPCFPQPVCVDPKDLGERPGTCPKSSGMPGICLFDPNVNCLEDVECPIGQKCCPNGCGSVCMAAVKPDPDVCQLPPETGPCKALFRRFYFDSDSNQCQTFNYGGCQGNGNNFETKEACEAACSKNVCRLPSEPGPCEAAITRYFFDSDSNQCKTFTYGGCQGNGNNFKTKEDCEASCFKPVKPVLFPKPTRTCATVRCRPGYKCVQRTIYCIRAPCPQPPPVCVPIITTVKPTLPPKPTLTCATVRCRPGYKCVQRTVYCIRAPCPQPRPVCVPITITKPGTCPRISPWRSSYFLCSRKVDTCQTDSQCRGDLKCCKTVCGKRCQKPLRDVGRCPFYPAWINPNCVRRDTCSPTDRNSCSPGTICCSTDCGRRCVTPM